MKGIKLFLILFMGICLGLAFYGCGSPKDPTGEERVVAKINKYNMTIEDFRDSAKSARGTKEEVLDQLIVRNILIQEAQKENFDKDKAFMKEIQGYWEQALLKLLIKKKTAEFSASFKGDKVKVEAAMRRWVKNLRSRANVTVYKENFDAVNIP